jgi:hypothetical protein
VAGGNVFTGGQPLFDRVDPDRDLRGSGDTSIGGAGTRSHGIPIPTGTPPRPPKRELEHMLDLSARDIVLAVRMYNPLKEKIGSKSGPLPVVPEGPLPVVPIQRISVSAQDVVVSFARPGRRRRRVLGRYIRTYIFV